MAAGFRKSTMKLHRLFRGTLTARHHHREQASLFMRSGPPIGPIGGNTPQILISSPFHTSHQANSKHQRATTNNGKPTKAWQRGAIAVKNTDVTNPYLETIRQTHDPALHVKTIEDELKSTIGQALGKQGSKILWAVREMEKEFDHFLSLAEQWDAAILAAAAEKEKRKLMTVSTASSSTISSTPTTHPTSSSDPPPKLLTKYEKRLLHKKIRKSAFAHNRWRVAALNARWEMVVQRQAIGFTLGNREYVHQSYPIADAILLEEDRQKLRKSTRKKVPNNGHWWQRINYWAPTGSGAGSTPLDKDEDKDLGRM